MGRAQSKREKDYQRAVDYYSREYYTKSEAKKNAFFDPLERELICTQDVFGPNTELIIFNEGEVLRDPGRRGSLQKLQDLTQSALLSIFSTP